MTPSDPHWLPLEGGANTRDVGGLPTEDGHRTVRGALIRSANLQHLTAGDIATLVIELGVRRIVDLRGDVEVEREGPGPLADQPEVTIHHLSLLPGVEPTPAEPVGVADEIEPAVQLFPGAADTAVALTGDPVADRYLMFLDSRPDAVVSALRAIADPDGATVVHCAAGKDRTGLIIALALTLVGVQREAIVADYGLTELRIAEIRQLLGRTETYRAHLATPGSVAPPVTDVMRLVLDELAARPGGAQGWLAQHGWTPEDTGQLRAKLVD
ncbi:MAG: protein tyrosine/serine phosphatase [Pseudonocardiales bacterium]|nr:protein tyrosine/serine phosphatase [Pseudonocardiales bacterium]